MYILHVRATKLQQVLELLLHTNEGTVVPALKTLGLSQRPALNTRFFSEAWCPVIANV